MGDFSTVPPLQGGIEFAEHFLRAKSKFTAFIFIDDLMAVGALNAFQQHGRQVPQELAIIGHDNSIFSLGSRPQLTTVDTKIEAMSTVVANTLHDIFLKKEVGNSIILRPELIVRQST